MRLKLAQLSRVIFIGIVSSVLTACLATLPESVAPVFNKTLDSNVTPAVVKNVEIQKLIPSNMPPGTLDLYDILSNYDDYVGNMIPLLALNKFYDQKRYCAFWKSNNIGCEDKFAKNEFEQTIKQNINGARKAARKIPDYVFVNTKFYSAQSSYSFDSQNLLIGPVPNPPNVIQVGYSIVRHANWPFRIAQCFSIAVKDKDKLLSKSSQFSTLGYLTASNNQIAIGKISMSPADAKLLVGGQNRVEFSGTILYKVTTQPKQYGSLSCGPEGLMFEMIPVKYYINNVGGKDVEITDFARMDGKW